MMTARCGEFYGLVVTDVSFIDPFELAHVLVEDRSDLPEYRGAYFCIKGNRILYIGKAEINLRVRWVDHHRYEQLLEMKDVLISYFGVSETIDLSGLEAWLIDRYKPALNYKPIPKHLQADSSRLEAKKIIDRLPKACVAKALALLKDLQG